MTSSIGSTICVSAEMVGIQCRLYLASVGPSITASMPGVQKPHCRPCFSVKPSCTGWSLPPCSSPSTVVILEPSAWTASTVHDFTGLPSRITVHAPQCEVSQPTWVPVNRNCSRIRCTSRRRDSTSASRTAPLMMTLILCLAILVSPRPLHRLAQCARRQNARHFLLVLDRAAPIGGGRALRRGHLRRFRDGFFVRHLADEILRRIVSLDRRETGVG